MPHYGPMERYKSQSDIGRYDVVVIGSGFSGSLAALILDKCGFRVCVIEKEYHPRFAIGESSTPVADMILRDLSDEYDLPWLKHFSRYGSWQRNYPELVCGIKRGFSYYKQKKGQRFESDRSHSRELLVAASGSDDRSDTNWYRSDFDAFLAARACAEKIPFFDRTHVAECRRSEEELWKLKCKGEHNDFTMEAAFLIDATGSPAFSAQFLGNGSSSDEFKTHSFSVFSHFDKVDRWYDYLKSRNFRTGDYPYNPDHSALHHLLDEGWMWMLRFNNNLLSAGFVFDVNRLTVNPNRPADELWNEVLGNYPSLSWIFRNSEIAAIPGRMYKSFRLQRKLDSIFGEGWAALPHTAGFVDPLHSTGIAHTLAGLEKLIDILKRNRIQNGRSPDSYSRDDNGTNGGPDNTGSATDRYQKHAVRFRTDRLYRELETYQSSVIAELDLVDTLVAACYRARHNFSLFTAASMLYFTCSHTYEKRRLSGSIPSRFLCAGDETLMDAVRQSFIELEQLLPEPADTEISGFIQSVRDKIRPWNSAGLLDEGSKNMYKHTAVEL